MLRVLVSLRLNQTTSLVESKNFQSNNLEMTVKILSFGEKTHGSVAPRDTSVYIPAR